MLASFASRLSATELEVDTGMVCYPPGKDGMVSCLAAQRIAVMADRGELACSNGWQHMRLSISVSDLETSVQATWLCR